METPLADNKMMNSNKMMSSKKKASDEPLQMQVKRIYAQAGRPTDNRKTTAETKQIIENTANRKERR